MRYLLVIILAVSWTGSAMCQETVYLDLVKAEARLQTMFTTLYSEDPGDVEILLEEIRDLMQGVLEMDGAMDFPWNGLDRIGVVTSDDRKLRVFTWHVMDDPDTFRYFGYIQLAGRKGSCDVFPLVNNGEPQRGLYNVDQSTDNWFGKLYYGIVTRKVKRRTYYTLLGMDFNNSRSNMKFVELLTIRWNKPRWEKECFSNTKQLVDRVVLEYSDQVAISVRYNPQLEMIVYDHLVPLHPLYENQFEYYGPDGSFDGLMFDGGIWILQEDVDARMPD